MEKPLVWPCYLWWPGSGRTEQHKGRDWSGQGGGQGGRKWLTESPGGRRERDRGEGPGFPWLREG